MIARDSQQTQSQTTRYEKKKTYSATSQIDPQEYVV
jgi:hypothetical protein